MKKMVDNYMNSISEDKPYKIQSFTYFIPGPKQFSQPYREKQFDKLFYDFINRGYEILEVKTEQCTSPSGSGMWIIFIVRATNSDSASLDLGIDNDSLQEMDLVDAKEQNNVKEVELPEVDDDLDIIPE